MFLGAWEGHHRSLAKAISWRLAGSLDTLVLSYLVTRSFLLAGSIGSYRTGDQVCVRGRRVQMSTCQQGITITVEWIGPARDCP